MTTTSDKPVMGYGLTVKAAKAYAATRQHKGSQGGWIHAPNGAALAHGWYAYYSRYAAQIRDFMTSQVTAMDTFQALVDTEPMYYPTIIPRTWREQYVADSFDLAMYARKSPRRAWRGSSPK